MHEFLKEIYAGWGKNIKVSQLNDTTLYSVLTDISSAEWVKEKVNQVRATVDSQQRQDVKGSLLPYFVLNKFKHNYRKNENFQEAKFIVADFDHVLDKIDTITSKLRLDPRVVAFFRSPSNDGVKIIFALDNPITDKDVFTSYYVDTITAISKEYDVTPDLSCKDSSRAVFFSHDPDPFVNPDYIPIVVGAAGKNGFSRKNSTKLDIEDPAAVSDYVLRFFQPATPGKRTNQMTSLIGLCINKSLPPDITLYIVREWNKKNNPPHSDKKVVDTVQSMFKGYKKVELPFEIVAKNNQYFRFFWDEEKKNSNAKLLTTFSLDPKELLITKEGDVLHCSVITAEGQTYENILLEVNDWSSENLNTAIGHMDCTVHASDSEVKVLKMYINNRIPIKKHGTRVVGLDDSGELWVVKNCNINKNGILADMTSIPYDKGGDAFYNKIEYLFQDDNTYKTEIGKFYENILLMNSPQAIVPLVGWNFIAPMRQKIMEYKRRFPVLFIPGVMGSGKTSTAQLFMKLHGYKSADVSSADMRRFPMLKALSSTNGIPVFIDEFKQSDMTDFSVNDIHRYIRKSTDGGVEPKGHADQTTTDYFLLAPWVLMGEWSIKTPAERERMIIPRFSGEIKYSVPMQAAYKIISEQTELRGFMPRYITYLLNQNIRSRYDSAYLLCEEHLRALIPAPRILHNLAVMATGIQLFIDYGVHLHFPKPEIDIAAILSGQLEEITGTPTGQVESSVDQLLREMSIMAAREKNDATAYGSSTLKEPWFVTVEHQGKRVLAIRFSLALPKLREFVKRTSSDLSMLEENGYRKILSVKETPYLISTSQTARFGGKLYKCILLDTEKMKSAGIDMEGFEEQ